MPIFQDLNDKRHGISKQTRKAIKAAENWLHNKENRSPAENELAFAKANTLLEALPKTQQALFLEHAKETYKPLFLQKNNIERNPQLTRLLATTQREVTKHSLRPLEARYQRTFDDKMPFEEKQVLKALTKWDENPTEHHKALCCQAIQVAMSKGAHRQPSPLEADFRQHLQLRNDVKLADIAYQSHTQAMKTVAAQSKMTQEDLDNMALYDELFGEDEENITKDWPSPP